MSGFKLNEMKNGLHLILALAVIATLTGCSTPYMTNRCRDAADIVTLGVGIGGGAKARVGPLQTGLLLDVGMLALRGGAVGSGGLCDMEGQLLITGVDFFNPPGMGNVFKQRGKSFKAEGSCKHPFWSHVADGDSAPYYYTQIELVAGLLFNVRVGVNPGELADFVLGWTTLDIFKDDIRVEGDYTYNVAGGQAAIIDFNEAYTGTLSITNTLGGYPVTSIGQNAFVHCENLTDVTIPSGVVDVGRTAFWVCSKLTSVTLPASVTNIEADSFACCNRLNVITVDTFNPVYSSSPDGVLFNKEKTELIRYPGGKAGEYATPADVKQIGRDAFFYIAGVTDVTIPNSVTSIGYRAFAYCSDLAKVAIPSQLSELGWSAFESCTNLTSVTIPGGVAKIEDWTFQDCSALSEVTIREGVTSIGWRAFAGCSSLTEITIPASVTEIAACAFHSCPKLTRVLFEGNAPIGASDIAIFCDTSSNVTVYYHPGAKGWGKEFSGRPTAVWKQ